MSKNKKPETFLGFRVLVYYRFLIYQSMISLKPEPVSAMLFLPVNESEQNTPFPLRLIVVEGVDCIAIYFFIIFCVIVFLIKYGTNIKYIIGLAKYFSTFF
jgi:hypothetical protein